MTDGSERSDRRWRVDSPERPAESRISRPAKVRARRVVSGGRVEEAFAQGPQPVPLRWPEESAGSTLIDRLDAHARSLGEALIARLADIDRREAGVHARLAELDAMRRELELWSSAERSKLSEVRAELAERSARVDADVIERRRELDRREAVLADSVVAVERAQAKIEELQRRCEEAMRRFDSDAPTSRDATRTARPESAPGTLRVIHVDAVRGRRMAASKKAVDARPTDAAEAVVPAVEPAKAPQSGPSSQTASKSDLIRLHEALLDKERYLADEARKLERARKAFAELRMTWIEDRLQRGSRPEAGEAMAELRSLRAELEREKLDRVEVQKRRHQRMQHLLEAIEDEITRLDLAWASVPQR